MSLLNFTGTQISNNLIGILSLIHKIPVFSITASVGMSVPNSSPGSCLDPELSETGPELGAMRKGGRQKQVLARQVRVRGAVEF